MFPTDQSAGSPQIGSRLCAADEVVVHSDRVGFGGAERGAIGQKRYEPVSQVRIIRGHLREDLPGRQTQHPGRHVRAHPRKLQPIGGWLLLEVEARSIEKVGKTYDPEPGPSRARIVQA